MLQGFSAASFLPYIVLFSFGQCIHAFPLVSRVSPTSVPLFSSSHQNQREFCTWLKQGAGRGPQDMAWQSWIPPSVHRRNPSALKQLSPRKNSVFCVYQMDRLWNSMNLWAFRSIPKPCCSQVFRSRFSESYRVFKCWTFFSVRYLLKDESQ